MNPAESTKLNTVLPPGSLGWPLIGESLHFIANKDFVQDHFESYGNIFKTKLFGASIIFLFGGEAVNFVLSNENNFFQAYPLGNTKSLFGNHSLSLQTGNIHQSRRRVIKTAFSSRKIDSHQNSIQYITESYLSKWQANNEFRWYPELKKYTFDVACKFLISIDNGSEKEIGKYFESWSKGLFSFAPALPFTSTKRALDDRENLLNTIDTIINNRRKQASQNDDVLSHLIEYRFEDGSALSLEEIKDQLLTLLFAGHETLTSALSSLCLNLSLNPNILNACKAEQDALNLNSTPTRADLDSMTYLDQVIRESLRLISPVLAGFRKVINPCSFNGYTFPKDWLVFYHIAFTNNNSEVYHQPEKFNPDRLSSERFLDLSKSTNYIPFGGGMRKCIGEDLALFEIKIFASNLISKCKWELSKNQNLDYNLIPVPAPKDGLKVTFL